MADKTKTIKGASDKELDELLVRLRKENEVQDLISYLKRKSNPPGNISYESPHVSTEEPIDTLYHYGILGMKWGKRKGGSSVSTSKKKTSSTENQSEDHKKKTNLKKKRISEMSNAELKDLTTRLQLEKQYKDLTKSETSAGKKFVTDVLTNAAKQTASQYVSKYMSKGVDEILKKTMK